ncbi:Interleukin-1 receptor accessory protein-like 1-B [Frankliniella fusca]|uniref:Soluble interferon alpha/beta receptor OPG204 n=1 Tax=Frankliniella fusca TaxID=407009 RepID=A0AAE1LQL3_9NEOP|nr:Interleukin-1 receptor accessory protein-like 1-B [Frankliniella fusca]
MLPLATGDASAPQMVPCSPKFKDGRPYPWAGDVSNFILYPESANQTVYSKMTNPRDGGNYTCRVRNDSHAYQHTVSLQVIDAVRGYMGAPLPTYDLPDEQLVQLGSTARLFCEAFVGSIDLPDAQSEITWNRVGMNSSYLEEQKRFTLRSVARENNQVLGAYLTIRGVRKEDLGPYECRVANAGDQAILLKLWLREAEPSEPLNNNPKWRQLALAAIVLLAVAIALTAFRHRLGILALFCRQRLVQPDLQDGKDYDVLLTYLERDSGFAAEMLSTLKERYSYTCNAYQIFPNNDCDIAQNLRDAAQRSRRLMVIIRPSLAEALSGSVVMNTLGGSALTDRVSALQDLDDVECWDSSVLASLLQQLTRIHPQPVCVSLQALPQGYELRDHALASLLRIAPVIEWNQKKSLWFKNWSLLRLRLPPLRTKTSTPSGSVAIVCPGSRKELGTGKVVTTVVSSRSRRSTPSINDSLEILV